MLNFFYYYFVNCFTKNTKNTKNNETHGLLDDDFEIYHLYQQNLHL